MKQYSKLAEKKEKNVRDCAKCVEKKKNADE